MNKFSIFGGSVVLKSDMSMFDIGKILSALVFNNCEFGGLTDYIHEECPAIYFEFMGLRFVLDKGRPNHTVLSIEPRFYIFENDKEHINLDLYLFQLLKEKLKDVPDVEVIMTVWPE